MSKMGLHGSFGYFKHKLWPKERPRVKLAIWLPTIKSHKSPWFTYVQVACHILLENSWWRLQFFFKPHLIHRSTQEVMGLQSCESPNFRNFETLNLGISGQNDLWVQALWPNIENILRGEGGGFLQVQAMVNLVNLCLPAAYPCTKSAPTTH